MPPEPDHEFDEDDALMLRLQGGDHRAFGELVQKHQSSLWGFFYRNTRDAQLAEDLTQDTLLKVHHQFWDYLPSGRFRGWMFRMARNLMIDDVRRKRHDALVRAVKGSRDDSDDAMQRIADEVIPAEVQVEHQELAAIMKELLAEIPSDQSLTFQMHHFEGLGLADVADAMDVPVATAKSRLRLAREKLVEKLTNRGFRESTSRIRQKNPSIPNES
jgi:RNA polymerase sigma-70 factor (ECF subfamily)